MHFSTEVAFPIFMTGINSTSTQTEQNVGQKERVLSTLAGSLLLATGLRKKRPYRMAYELVGAALMKRGTTGHCMMYESLGINTSGTSTWKNSTHSITVNCSRQTAYEGWKKFLRQDSEIIAEYPPSRMLWKMAGPAGAEFKGEADFITHSDENQTEVKFILTYRYSTGNVGMLLAKFKKTDPDQLNLIHLKAFKNWIEGKSHINETEAAS